MDRRQRKSRQIIFTVFLDLLSKKDISDISVSEIAEKSDLSRGTFYSQFLDKFDLLDKFVETHLFNLFNVCTVDTVPSKDYFNEVIGVMIVFLLENRSVYSILFNHHDTYKFRDIFIENMVLAFQEQNNETSLVVKRINKTDIQFLCYGILGVLRWFVNHSESIPPQDISNELCELMDKIYLR